MNVPLEVSTAPETLGVASETWSRSPFRNETLFVVVKPLLFGVLLRCRLVGGDKRMSPNTHGVHIVVILNPTMITH